MELNRLPSFLERIQGVGQCATQLPALILLLLNGMVDLTPDAHQITLISQLGLTANRSNATSRLHFGLRGPCNIFADAMKQTER